MIRSNQGETLGVSCVNLTPLIVRQTHLFSDQLDMEKLVEPEAMVYTYLL